MTSLSNVCSARNTSAIEATLKIFKVKTFDQTVVKEVTVQVREHMQCRLQMRHHIQND